MSEIIHQVLSMPPPFNMITVIVVVVVGVGGITSIASGDPQIRVASRVDGGHS